MFNFPLILIILPFFVVGWDQIQVKTFMTIFPYARQPDVWKLTFDVNHQESTADSRKILNDWVDSKWVQVIKSPTKMIMQSNTSSFKIYPDEDASWYENDKKAEKPPLWKYRDLSDKEFARQQGLSFIEHRWTIKMFMRFMYRTLQGNNVFNEEQAQKMRSLFWESDTDCLNYFRCTGPMFFNKTAEAVASKNRTSEAIMDLLYMYGTQFTQLPPIAEKLNWKLEGAPSRIPMIDYGYNSAG